MRILRSPLFVGLFVAVTGVATLVGVYLFVNHFLTSAQTTVASSSCHILGAHHVVDIFDDKPSEVHTAGKLCDTLTITNEDQRLRLIAFGPHEHHEPYDGVTEKVLAQGQSLTVTLNQAGTFYFHDHIDDVMHGDFTVTR